VNPLREEREYAVRAAAEQERAAWSALERVSRPDAADEVVLNRFRERWQTASRSLVEALKALTLLKEEGSSIAFPATVDQMHEDMESVATRLADTKVDDITIGYEEDIIAALEEMIDALQQAQQNMEKKKQQQQKQQQQQQQQDQPLVDEIAELKMIKSLQERVNKRTTRYSRLLQDDQDPVGQANAAELVSALKKLSERQQEVYKITRDLVLGKNK